MEIAQLEKISARTRPMQLTSAESWFTALR